MIIMDANTPNQPLMPSVAGAPPQAVPIAAPPPDASHAAPSPFTKTVMVVTNCESCQSPFSYEHTGRNKRRFCAECLSIRAAAAKDKSMVIRSKREGVADSKTIAGGLHETQMTCRQVAKAMGDIGLEIKKTLMVEDGLSEKDADSLVKLLGYPPSGKISSEAIRQIEHKVKNTIYKRLKPFWEEYLESKSSKQESSFSSNTKKGVHGL